MESVIGTHDLDRPLLAYTRGHRQPLFLFPLLEYHGFRRSLAKLRDLRMKRAWCSVLAMMALLGGPVGAWAGPCAAEITQVEQRLRELRADAAASSAGQPTAPQSTAAQLHHQPTPQSVESAVGKADAAAAEALERARKADAEGKAVECRKALSEAKQLYGLE